MKKKILFIGLFLVAAIVASFQFKEGLFGEFGAENIDALASGEWDKPAHCVGTGTVDCPSTHVKVYFVARHYSLDQSMYG